MKTTIETYSFPSSDGVNTCSGVAVIPEDEVHALMILSHGMAEYIRRYLPFMQILASHGILCFGHDHVGHGATAASEHDLGYIPRKTGADILISDVIHDAERFHSCYPTVPLILFGHSMGSFIARLAACSEHASLFDALILSGTGAKNPLAGFGMALLRLLCTIRGERAISLVMHGMIFSGYQNRFEKRTAFDWISSDPTVVDRYLSDPLCGFPFTVSALYVLVSMLHACNTKQAFCKTPDPLPILLISGRDDPVGGFGNGVHAVADAYIAAGCTHVSHTLYTGARHELLNEPIADQVTEELLAWLTDLYNPQQKRSVPT